MAVAQPTPEKDIDWGGLGTGIGSIFSVFQKNQGMSQDSLAMLYAMQGNNRDTSNNNALWGVLVAFVIIVIVAFYLFKKS